MAEVSPLRRNIHAEDVQFKSAISEAVGFKLGQSLNFINTYQHSEKQFFLNGLVNRLSPLPYLGVDGMIIVQFDMTIINVYMYVQEMGTGGTTEFDIKRAVNPAAGFTSIFAGPSGVTPKADHTTANYSWIGFGETVSGMTAPVLNSAHVDINAGDCLRMDLLQAQTGSPRGAGLIVHYRPR
jgi:hypothetical protein